MEIKVELTCCVLGLADKSDSQVHETTILEEFPSQTLGLRRRPGEDKLSEDCEKP